LTDPGNSAREKIDPAEVDLAVSLGRLELRNPVLTASGTFGWGEEYAEFAPAEKLGGIVTKSVSRRPREGNPPPRIAETAAGLLNAIGLENPGLERFLAEELPRLRQLRTAVVVNIVGETIEEFAELAHEITAAAGAGGVAALELNISCPNVKAGGMAFSQDPETARRLVAAVRAATDLPLMAKLSPNVTDVVAIARAVVAGGAEIVSLVNTLLATAIDARARRFRLGNVTGGLSGPAIKPVALRMVHEVARALPETPVIGIGGIFTAEDVAEFLLAGASAVEIGTASFLDPARAAALPAELARFLAEEMGARSAAEIVGQVRREGEAPAET